MHPRPPLGATRFLLVASLLLTFPLTVSAVSFDSGVEDGTYKLYSVETDHFRIEFDQKMANSADSDGDDIPDKVEDVADYAETSWDVLVDGTILPDPLDQWGYQDRIYLFMDGNNTFLSPGTLGVASILSTNELYFAVDPNLGAKLMKVTVAHEFLHAIQFSYQGAFAADDRDIVFAEQTATAIEEIVYPEVNDYMGYVGDYLNNVDYSIWTSSVPAGTLFEYGTALWPVFLMDYLDDESIVPEAIQAYFESDPDTWDAYEAYAEVLDDRDVDLPETYQMFALWNLVQNVYDDGDDFSDFPTSEVYHSSDEIPLTDEILDESSWPALFGTNYLDFEMNSDFWGNDFQFTITKSADLDFGVVLIPLGDDYEYDIDDATITMVEEGYEEAVITVPIPDDSTWMTAIVTPVSSDPMELESESEAFVTAYGYYYSAEIDDFLDDDEAEIDLSESGDDDLTETTSDEEKEGEDPSSEQTAETEIDEFKVSELAVTSQGDDWVALRWTRVLSQEVAGYVIYYGSSSGEYYISERIEGRDVTHAVIRDLYPASYYFVVVPYFDDGTEADTYSNEVSATLDLPSYSDVDESNDHYYAVQFISYLGLTEGYDDGTFQTESNINRAELMKIMVAPYFETSDYSIDDYTGIDCFPDVQSGDWFEPYVCLAAEEGWVQGYEDGYFHPENSVTNAEALKIIMEIYPVEEIPESVSASEVIALPYDDVFVASWFSPYVVRGYEMGILEQTGSEYAAGDVQTRGGVVETLFRIVVVQLMFESVYDEDLLDSFLDTWAPFFL